MEKDAEKARQGKASSESDAVEARFVKPGATPARREEPREKGEMKAAVKMVVTEWVTEWK
jgi:hypothetical protein